MFKIFAMPLLAITIITWNTTAWGAVSGGQAGTEEGDCSSYTFLPITHIDTGNGGDNCSTHNYMCKDTQCIMSCTACTVGDLKDGFIDMTTGCSFKTCSTGATSCSKVCDATRKPIDGWDGYVKYEYLNQTTCECNTAYECASGYSETELRVFCSKNLNTGNFTCNGCQADEPATQSCSAGKYLSGNSCVACPDGYPNSAAGSDAITDCYSGTKSRAWTGSQTACSKPSGCASVSCDTCSIAACDYVAYSNSAGTGDGTIKSGCSSNSAACQKPVASVTASANYYVSGKTCPACPTTYPSSDGGSIGSESCYGSFSKSGSQEECSPTSDNVVNYTCASSCTPVPCTYTMYASGTIKEDCTPTNCTKDLVSVTCKSGYYPRENDKKCILCTEGYYCNGSKRKQCPEIKSGSGEYGTSKEGSTSINDCYVPNNPDPLTATDDTGTYVCISDAYYKTGTN